MDHRAGSICIKQGAQISDREAKQCAEILGTRHQSTLWLLQKPAVLESFRKGGHAWLEEGRQSRTTSAII